MARDFKYLLAYLLPFSALWGLYAQGAWAWSAVTLSFVILPVLDQLLPQSTSNVPAGAEERRSNRLFFDILLYLNAPLLFAALAGYFLVLKNSPLSGHELAGLTLGAGILVGTIGINVAHELGHRSNKGEQQLAKWLLMTALYQHFFIEHNRGHHKHVATDKDPATARYGEWIFGFWWRSAAGGWINAWRLEALRLRKTGKPVFSLHNEMLRFQLWQLGWLVAVGVVFGPKALAGAVAVAIIGFLLLETINYIEHYGLRRRLLPTGQPEPVGPQHSWNSDHELGRIFLYELTRHSDHHYKASRKYQILRHFDASPQLPFGYPASILLALAPPLWFALMNPRVQKLTE